MDYGYLERRQKFNDKMQLNDFLDIIKNNIMPQYTSANLDKTRGFAADATAGLADPYKTNQVGNVFGGNEFSGLAKNIYDTGENLNAAERGYTNQYKDWGTNAQNENNQVTFGLGNKAAYNALQTSQANRLADLGILNSNRTSTGLINANRLAAAKKAMQEKSDRLRESTNANGVVDFLAALGTIIGSIYASPAGGAAIGAGIKAGGTAVVRNNYK